MENSSKALIMAGSVLIAIGVIAVALYAYANFRGYIRSSEEMLSANQIASFNRYYEAFDDGSGRVRGVDAVNIYNKAIDDGVSVSCSNAAIQNLISAVNNGTSNNYDGKNFLNTFSYRIVYDRIDGRVSTVYLGE